MGKKDIDASEAANLRKKQVISNQFSHLPTVANLRTNCHVCGITSKVYPQKFKDFDVNFEIHKKIGFFQCAKISTNQIIGVKADDTLRTRFKMICMKINQCLGKTYKNIFK